MLLLVLKTFNLRLHCTLTPRADIADTDCFRAAHECHDTLERGRLDYVRVYTHARMRAQRGTPAVVLTPPHRAHLTSPCAARVVSETRQ